MNLIPVLDLAGGVAVHARRGERERYRPVESRVLPGTADPVLLAMAFRRHGFRSLYIADLDALTGRGNHREVVERIRATSGLAVLLDAGVRTCEDLAKLAASGVEQILVGTETLASFAELAAMLRTVGPDRVTFSLDVRGGRVLSPDPEVAAQAPAAVMARAAQAGVKRAVVIDLSAVGSEGGPPVPLLAALHAVVPACELMAGGGVRGDADLRALQAAGIAGSLIATCLHTGALTDEEVAHWLQPR